MEDIVSNESIDKIIKNKHLYLSIESFKISIL